MVDKILVMDVINKIGAIILKNRKILVGRKRDKFIIPGGKIEQNENDIECLRRELKEEFKLTLISQEYFGNFEDNAALDPGMKIKMVVYMVDVERVPKAAKEISELRYINSKDVGKIKIGSILEKFVIPELVKRNLIE